MSNIREFYAKRQKILIEIIEQNPELPNRTLAKIIMFKYPYLFGTLEQARCGIRYLKGANGESNRNILLKTHNKIYGKQI